MRAEKENTVTEELAAEVRPIELVTENGFSIVRQWEIDRVPPPKGRNFQFLVRDPQGAERKIVVDISSDVLWQLSMRVRSRIVLCASFWICCAEGHLASYLWENEACPSGNELIVQHLDPREIMLAVHWQLD